MPVTDTELEDLAKHPETTTTDGVTVTERSAQDVIALDEYAAQKRAVASGKARNPFALLRPVRLLPPGSA